MLKKLDKKDFDKYADWAYGLALDITRSSYPTYTDGIKTKQEFINNALKAFSDSNRGILLFSDGGQVLGWINYYFIPEDKYISLEAFNTESKTKQALKEFEQFCKVNFKGFTLYMGFAEENAEAISYFKENGYNLLEISYPHVLRFKNSKTPINSCNVIKIEKDNYFLFEKLHKLVDGDMYWNTERISKNLSDWQIYYYDDGITQGAIYFTGKKLQEIFGVDFSDNKYNHAVFRELVIKCISVCPSLGAEHLYYFSENDERETLSELGFKSLGVYNCYSLYLT